ncbi:hypothetical protein HK405_002584, partial [Cladochytrium tenue]
HEAAVPAPDSQLRPQNPPPLTDTPSTLLASTAKYLLVADVRHPPSLPAKLCDALALSRLNWTTKLFTTCLPVPLDGELVPLGVATVVIGPHFFPNTRFFKILYPLPPPDPPAAPASAASSISTATAAGAAASTPYPPDGAALAARSPLVDGPLREEPAALSAAAGGEPPSLEEAVVSGAATAAVTPLPAQPQPLTLLPLPGNIAHDAANASPAGAVGALTTPSAMAMDAIGDGLGGAPHVGDADAARRQQQQRFRPSRVRRRIEIGFTFMDTPELKWMLPKNT